MISHVQVMKPLEETSEYGAWGASPHTMRVMHPNLWGQKFP